jgi:hypothetical protein
MFSSHIKPVRILPAKLVVKNSAIVSTEKSPGQATLFNTTTYI